MMIMPPIIDIKTASSHNKTTWFFSLLKSPFRSLSIAVVKSFHPLPTYIFIEHPLNFDRTWSVSCLEQLT